jgi:hypothetical protein
MANIAKTEAVKDAAPTVKRERRTPASGARDKLTVYGKDPNFVYRWVRNDEGRIQWFQERGYDVVTGDLEVGQKTVDSGSKLGSAVTKFGGGAVTLVLMRIPKEWYDEDQAAKEDAVASTEATMRNPEAQVGGKAYGRFDITRK